MSNTEEKIRRLVDENLEIEGRPMGRPLNLDSSLRDSGVSSLDFVAFSKLLAAEFGVEVGPDVCASLSSVRELIEFLDANAA